MTRENYWFPHVLCKGPGFLLDGSKRPAGACFLEKQGEYGVFGKMD